jgi:hypothetical protein
MIRRDFIFHNTASKPIVLSTEHVRAALEKAEVHSLQAATAKKNHAEIAAATKDRIVHPA